MTLPSVAFLVQRIGPYHHARLCAFAAGSGRRVTAIEFRAGDALYAWDTVREEGGYGRIQTHSRRELFRALDEIRPQVVVCVGYSDPEIHQAVDWAFRRHVPLVTCSDSTYADEPRHRIKEAFKRQIVGAFDSALVAGRRARDYLETLGTRRDRCFQPWDVVDNEYFARGADLVHRNPDSERARLGLPQRYFLCVARFVAKKNLAGLIEAFAQYSGRAGTEAWSLVLSGLGPLETELRARVASAGLESRVVFPGFLQVADLPACYGLASGFVLPSLSDQWGLVVNEAMAAGLPVVVSSRCGCVPELVREGENGFTFDPEDTAELAACLERLAELDETRRNAMGRRSEELVGVFTPAAFAEGLESAIACAVARRRRGVRAVTRLLFSLLSLHKPGSG
jgi:glycosyltransferase involved in cell wall biosynthesis